MAPPPTFGQRLRELRRAKDLSLRQLAERVGVDFTYLSKVENDRTPPPSAKTIALLATELDGDEDELALLAEKLPADLIPVFQSSPAAIKFFRSIAGDIRDPSDWQRVLKSLKAELGERD
jgi:HTH-type transcriptional regulator, competence development regulator